MAPVATFAALASLGAMRLLKALVTGLLAVAAIIGGVIATVVIAIAAFVYYGLRRALRRPVAAGSPSHARPRGRTAGDAIDVIATEVPVEPPAQIR